jgi:hypothetical protein
MKSTSTAVVVCLMLSAGQAALAGTNDILALPHLKCSLGLTRCLIWFAPHRASSAGAERGWISMTTREELVARLSAAIWRSRGAADGLAAPLFWNFSARSTHPRWRCARCGCRRIDNGLPTARSTASVCYLRIPVWPADRACANAGAGLQRLVDLAAVNILLMWSRRCSMPTG